MTVLSGEQRKLLSDVVVRAREVVETACLQRITALGIETDKAPDVLTEGDRAVRVGLRARARQLGSVEALVTEAGFEHWHRMLFARFLADNGLLVDDQFGQALTMVEVAEYAAESGESDVWEVAARFAAAMLPGIFTQNDPILAMRLPVETRQELERLLDQLTTEVITAEDSLGWVYQYWQSRRKDEVNNSERKIGGADLAPVTQLFTENYMVRFLLENSLGAWWATRHPESPLLVEWGYMRRDEAGPPVVDGFVDWPSTAAEVTLMDPCCGSGHFLVAAFGMLWRMRVEEEGLDPAAAQDAVLRDNLFGLELDPRCTQIAMFALALEAWKAGGFRQLPLPNVACCGVPARAPLADWIGLAGGEPQVEAALARLHALFANADTLGSLIDPIRAAEQAGLESVDWHSVAPLVQTALAREASHRIADPAAAVFGHAAAGIARAADYLSRSYTLICMNPPYLGQTKFAASLRSFLDESFPSARYDLATVFLERFGMLRAEHVASVTPADWLVQVRLAKFRHEWAQIRMPLLVSSLGYSGFREVLRVQPLLMIDGRRSGISIKDFRWMDVSHERSTSAVATALQHMDVSESDAIRFMSGRWDWSIGEAAVPLLELLVEVREGLKAGDVNRFEGEFWEVEKIGGAWELLQDAPDTTAPFRGRSRVVLWENEQGRMAALADSVKHLNHVAQNWRRGKPLWGREGVAFGLMGDLPATIYSGERFGANCAAIVPKDPTLVTALWAFAQSGMWSQALRSHNRGVAVTPHALTRVPFDVEHWCTVAATSFPAGLPEPHSADPTQWLFRGEIQGARFPLQVAVARLVGYHWPDQVLDGLDALVDVDGIVCLPALGGESTAEERLRSVLATAHGDSWSTPILDALLLEEGAKAGAGGLEKWLRDLFFKDHCKVFANRPFVWQIWDGRPDGFSALVNYHKLDRKLLERLTHDYLGSWWIGRVNDEIRQQVPGAEARLAAAEGLKGRLKLILEGEPPYDIFVRWKSLDEQPMGWEPDLDDGVRMNIRPFMEAGVLRAKPNIKWEKDRGKNPDGTERLNDLHFTLAQKRAARGAGV